MAIIGTELQVISAADWAIKQKIEQVDMSKLALQHGAMIAGAGAPLVQSWDERELLISGTIGYVYRIAIPPVPVLRVTVIYSYSGVTHDGGQMVAIVCDPAGVAVDSVAWDMIGGDVLTAEQAVLDVEGEWGEGYYVYLRPTLAAGMSVVVQGLSVAPEAISDPTAIIAETGSIYVEADETSASAAGHVDLMRRMMRAPALELAARASTCLQVWGEDGVWTRKRGGWDLSPSGPWFGGLTADLWTKVPHRSSGKALRLWVRGYKVGAGTATVRAIVGDQYEASVSVVAVAPPAWDAWISDATDIIPAGDTSVRISVETEAGTTVLLYGLGLMETI